MLISKNKKGGKARQKNVISIRCTCKLNGDGKLHGDDSCGVDGNIVPAGGHSGQFQPTVQRGEGAAVHPLQQDNREGRWHSDSSAATKRWILQRLHHRTVFA
jgi:hypothetical protein